MNSRYQNTSRPGLGAHQIHGFEYQRLDLPAAEALLPIVRNISRQCHDELKPIQRQLNYMVPADPRNHEVKAAYRRVVESWAGKIERLGLKVYGLWQVGIDCGEGWYGWQYPERRIRYFLEYDQGFSERQLMQDRHLGDPGRVRLK